VTDAERLATAVADRYRVEREIGLGGMATVYLAHDLKHDREVAIKVLHPDLGAALGGHRFLSEIKTTAKLQHPHILPLLDSGDAGGLLYYVMPFVAGETLRARLERDQQLPIDDALRIAREVADALGAAHALGIVHRDIKPENILLQGGHALVADFGIALAVQTASGARMTQTGLSLGTPQYMSPEQAMGERQVDARSDIYALGAVTYEMLTGEPPFTGGSVQAIVAKVMSAEPERPTLVRKTIPPHVEAAVLRALQKLPADRYGSAVAFSDALDDRHFAAASTAPGAGYGAAASDRSIARSRLVWGLGTALVAVAAFAGLQWRAAHSERPRNEVRFSMQLPSTMLATNATGSTNVAVSPDGNTIAYAVPDGTGATRLYVRSLNDAVVHVVSGTEGAQQPVFSPDGQWIAYMVGNAVWKVQRVGGIPALVGQMDLGAVGLAWGGTGQIIAGSARGLIAIPIAGGSPTVLASLDSAQHELYFNQPRIMPDGKTVLFSIQPSGGLTGIHLGKLSLETGVLTRTNLALLDVAGYTDGTLVYVLTSGALMAVPFDYRTARTTGDAIALGPFVSTLVAFRASVAAMSRTGTLIYQPGVAASMMGWVDMHGMFTPLLPAPQGFAFPRLSSDGKRIAVGITDGGRSDIWVYDIASATFTRLTNSGAQNDRPEWMPDGRRVIYRADRGKRTGIWWQPADLSGPATPLQADDRSDYYEGVLSPDGKDVVYQVDDAGAQQADVFYRSLNGDTTSRPVAATRFVEAQARVSPDGKWVAYVTDASGASQVVVQPFPGPGGQVQVSTGGGSEPVWSRDERRLFYRDGKHVVAASVSSTNGFTVTSRANLFADDYAFALSPHANYDVSPDGTRLLMIRGAGTLEYDVVYGFGTELRARVKSGVAN
jgi:eukaryotic-like serine/threonine-protein kinase